MATAANGSGGAFYMYLGLPQAYRNSPNKHAAGFEEQQQNRSQSVMGTVDAPYSKSYAAGLANRYQDPPVAVTGRRSKSPERMPKRWAADDPYSQEPALGTSADDQAFITETILQSSASFGKLKKLKDMLDLNLITEVCASQRQPGRAC